MMARQVIFDVIHIPPLVGQQKTYMSLQMALLANLEGFFGGQMLRVDDGRV